MRNILMYVIASLLIVAPAFADDIVITNNQSVENNVSVSASTGGNSVSPGQTINQGEVTGSIYIETKVNGETVELVDETYSGSTTVQKQVVHESGSTSVRTSVEVSTEGHPASGSAAKNTFVGQTALVEGAERVGTSTNKVVASQALANVRFEMQSLLAEFFSRIKTYVFAFFTW